MTLLAQYIRSVTPQVLDLRLIDIESREILHHITDEEADAANIALIHAGEQWAKAHGHTICTIDSHILNQNF
jgi:hypothetical protein